MAVGSPAGAPVGRAEGLAVGTATLFCREGPAVVDGGPPEREGSGLSATGAALVEGGEVTACAVPEYDPVGPAGASAGDA